MFPLKRFVQGPSLQDEVVSYDDDRSEGLPPRTGTLTGEEVSRVYQEIINLPSTASTSNCEAPSAGPTTSSSCSRSSSNTTKIVKLEEADEEEDKEPPKLSQLMSFCEANDHARLQENLEDFPYLVHDVDEYGWNLLMSASCAGAVHCVSILLQNGAFWNTQDRKGLTALDIARKNRQDGVVDLIQKWDACYRERIKRLEREKREGASTSTSGGDASDVPDTDHDAGSSKRYCEVCRFAYESLQDEHERSIAHLVSTAEFGNDKIHFGIPESNKGFQLMVKGGWDKNSGLGPDGQGHKFPVKTVLKRNRLGVGNEKEKKAARITHFGPFDSAAVEGPERLEREVTVRRRDAAKSKSKEKRKEINFRREFASL